MSDKQKRFAIVGGGLSGLGCISMLKEEGFDPICFERTDRIGGTWNYREVSEDGVASIMPTTVINHSKEMGALSNFPPKKESNNYMRHNELFQYVMDYCAERDLLRHVRVSMEVLRVRRSEDYDETGRWTVTVKDVLTGEESTDIYDGVLLCVGHINRPRYPTYPGQDNFEGTIMHTHSLKGVSDFKGHNVVVVGMGCSALDAAVELTSVAKQVYLSTRSGSHVINRVGPNGKPIDSVLLRRYLAVCLDIFPTKLCSWFVRRFYLDPKFDYKLYSVRPKYDMLATDPVVNDHIASKLLSGAVVQKRDIEHFTENGVVFNNEQKETPVDTVVMATGYNYKFPFLEDGMIEDGNGLINLYKCVWPPHLKHPTLAVIGLLIPFGPGIPLGELQCRWAAHVFSGKGKLPSTKQMKKECKKRLKKNTKRYKPCDRLPVRVDYMQYLDSIAKEVGVKPNFLKLFFTDIALFHKMWFGPILPYQYRLSGPHKWDGARDAIMDAEKRMVYCLRNQ